MTIIVAFIVGHIGAILGAIMGAGGLAFGAFRHQQAKAATSQAQAAIAKVGEQQAQSEAQAQAYAAQAVDNKQQAAQDAAKVPNDQLDSVLDQMGGLRK